MNIFSRFQIHILTKTCLFAHKYLVILRNKKPQPLLYSIISQNTALSSISTCNPVSYPKTTLHKHYTNTTQTLHKHCTSQNVLIFKNIIYISTYIYICSLYIVSVQCQCSLYLPQPLAIQPLTP